MVLTIFRDKYSFRNFRKLFLCICVHSFCVDMHLCVHRCVYVEVRRNFKCCSSSRTPPPTSVLR